MDNNSLRPENDASAISRAISHMQRGGKHIDVESNSSRSVEPSRKAVSRKTHRSRKGFKSHNKSHKSFKSRRRVGSAETDHSKTRTENTKFGVMTAVAPPPPEDLTMHNSLEHSAKTKKAQDPSQRQGAAQVSERKQKEVSKKSARSHSKTPSKTATTKTKTTERTLDDQLMKTQEDLDSKNAPKTITERNSVGESQRQLAYMGYAVYPQRWYILLGVCLLALSNAMQWISYLGIGKITDVFFCGIAEGNGNGNNNETVKDEYDRCKIGFWSNQIFQFVAMAMGLFGMYITDKYGIKLSLICGASFNMIGSILRFSCSFPSFPLEYRQIVLHSGSVVAAAAQPFFLVLSPKVAEFWFPEHQRALANVLSFIANPLGVAVGSLIPSAMFHGASPTVNSTHMLKLNSILMGMAIVVFVMALFTRRSVPPTPPSASSSQHGHYSLKRGIQTIFGTPAYVVLLFPFGLAFAINWSVFVVTDSILSDLGYGEIAGYMTAIAAVSGGVTSIIAGTIVDKTKAFKGVLNVCYIGLFLTSLALALWLHFEGGGAFSTSGLVILFICLGGFCIPVFPIGIELGVETTFPVPEATSSGFLVIFANLCMFAVTFSMDSMTKIKPYFVDYTFPDNYWIALDLWCVYGAVGLVLVLFALKPRCKRLEYELAVLNDPQLGECATQRSVLSEERRVSGASNKPEQSTKL